MGNPQREAEISKGLREVSADVCNFKGKSNKETQMRSIEKRLMGELVTYALLQVVFYVSILNLLLSLAFNNVVVMSV